MKKNPILITGAHRSGTTWVGKMLNLTPFTHYIGEVLRPDTELLEPGLVHYWYQYSSPEPEGSLHQGMQRLLSFNFSWPSRSPLFPSRLWLYRHTRQLFGFPRPLLKDPMAAMSAENLANAFQMQVVCLIRHPAAFVASVKRAGWRFGFRNFLAQPALMRRWLGPYARRLKDRPHDSLEEAALLWACINRVLHAYIQRNPAWIVWRHEDICAAPHASFKSIYRQLELPFDSIAAQRIQEYSDPDNPLITQKSDSIMRDTRALVDLWRGEISDVQAQRIREIVEPVSRHYYSDAEW